MSAPRIIYGLLHSFLGGEKKHSDLHTHTLRRRYHNKNNNISIAYNQLVY
jgi:hypothetical protein